MSLQPVRWHSSKNSRPRGERLVGDLTEIAVFGSCNVDLVLHGGLLPDPGRPCCCFRETMGGKRPRDPTARGASPCTVSTRSTRRMRLIPSSVTSPRSSAAAN